MLGGTIHFIGMSLDQLPTRTATLSAFSGEGVSDSLADVEMYANISSQSTSRAVCAKMQRAKGGFLK